MILSTRQGDETMQQLMKPLAVLVACAAVLALPCLPAQASTEYPRDHYARQGPDLHRHVGIQGWRTEQRDW
jgi:hypothetical protein